MDIILASGSPRRHELLAAAQLEFSIMSVDIDETPHDDESPKDYIQRMVTTKATAAVAKLNADHQNNQSQLSTFSLALNIPFIILTADTIGVLPDGKTVLVKPTDCNHAYSMWQRMSDKTHQVWTAVQATQVILTAIDKTNSNDSISSVDTIELQVIWQQQIIERTDVSFVPLTPDMMANYWNSGEPADKAGGYGIQGLAAAWVTRINGSYTNVVGLPLAQTLALINDASNGYNNNKIKLIS
ncbi:septum formation protein Maf [Psychrobacter frigidicola]|uniref:dTTP/UTP pyrophosphatase n=1 Tax=Psychrobacter frigidicola TaxID=45611 RepID=A0A5C6ZZY4_9GAMM|nr:Maf family protein [Psychrobacter frigidicola]TXD96543.1 septum formation protein Maf [Psychrobacter frigidicola]